MQLAVKTMVLLMTIFHTVQVKQLVHNIASTVDQEQINMGECQLNPKVVQSYTYKMDMCNTSALTNYIQG